jgi:hypothetical protein
VIDGVTGRSVPIDPHAFVSTGLEMLGDLPALQVMGRAGAAHARARLTFDRQLSSTLQLYDRLAASTGGRL